MSLIGDQPAVVQITHQSEAALMQRRKRSLAQSFGFGNPMFAVARDELAERLLVLARPSRQQRAFAVDVGFVSMMIADGSERVGEQTLAGLDQGEIFLHMTARRTDVLAECIEHALADAGLRLPYELFFVGLRR